MHIDCICSLHFFKISLSSDNDLVATQRIKKNYRTNMKKSNQGLQSHRGQVVRDVQPQPFHRHYLTFAF